MSTVPSTPLFDGRSSQNSNLLLQSTPISSISKPIHANQGGSIITPSLNELFLQISQRNTPVNKRPHSHYTILPTNNPLSCQTTQPPEPISLRQPLVLNNLRSDIPCDNHPTSNTNNTVRKPLSTNCDVLSNHNSLETGNTKTICSSPNIPDSKKFNEMFRDKVNQTQRVKAAYNIILITVFISCISITVSAFRVDSFMGNLPKSPERVANNQRHQFEYGFWTMAFVTTLFHLMISTTLLIICLIHLYCSYSITKTMTFPDENVILYFNSTAIWRSIMVYFYLVSLMFSIVTNTCFVFVIPANIGIHSKGTVLATGAFLCIFILFVAFHTLFKWCKLTKEEQHFGFEKSICTQYSPIPKGCNNKIDINSLSTVV